MQKSVFIVCILLSLLAAVPVSAIQQISPDSVYARASAVFKRIETAKGRFLREITVAGKQMRYEGRFIFKSPACHFFEYALPERQIISKTDSSLTVYYPARNEALCTHVSSANKKEGILLESLIDLPVTILSDFAAGFTFSLSDTFDNSFVIKAEPARKRADYTYALLKIGKGDFVLQAIELFNRKNVLFNQMLFINYKRFSGNVFFPGDIVNKIITGNTLFEENLELSRIRINEAVDDGVFSIRLPEGTNIRTTIGEKK